MEQNLKISTLNPTDAEQENPNPKDEIPVVPSPLPFPLFISLSLSTTLSPPPHLHSNPSSFSPFPNKLKIPSQISSLSTLSLTSTFTPHNKPSLKHTISSSPLQIPLFNTPHHSPHPKNIPAIRRCSIVWFRNDLRVHDNECLNSANNDSMSVLPVYCFNPQDYGKSSSGFNKIGSHRATFLINSVFDLRNSLKSRGSNLVVRIGKPENVLVELVKEVGADGVFVHREVSKDEVREEEKVEKAVKEEGVEVKYFWGSTLHHVDDLPFKLDDMPTNYNMFKEKAKKSEIRKTIDGLDQLKGLPTRGDVELGEIPTLLDLGLRPVATVAQDGELTTNASLVGGETEALQRLKKFAAECLAQPTNLNKDGGQGSMFGANFSCKISPWLATGCLSPRFMFDEIKKSAARKVDGNGPSAGGMNWLMFELLWRDFFRFITKKCSSPKKMLESAPATASTGSLALAC